MKHQARSIIYLFIVMLFLVWFLVSDPRRTRAEKFLKFNMDRHGIAYSKIICPDVRVAFGVTDSSTIGFSCKVEVGQDQLGKLTDMSVSTDKNQELRLKINLEAHAGAWFPSYLGFERATWLPLESALEIEVETNR